MLSYDSSGVEQYLVHVYVLDQLNRLSENLFYTHFLNFTIFIVLLVFLISGKEPSLGGLTGTVASKECQVSAPPAEKR